MLYHHVYWSVGFCSILSRDTGGSNWRQWELLDRVTSRASKLWQRDTSLRAEALGLAEVLADRRRAAEGVWLAGRLVLLLFEWRSWTQTNRASRLKTFLCNWRRINTTGHVAWCGGCASEEGQLGNHRRCSCYANITSTYVSDLLLRVRT